MIYAQISRNSAASLFYLYFLDYVKYHCSAVPYIASSSMADYILIRISSAVAKESLNF